MAQSFRVQVAVWHDSLAPKDAICIDPCFHVGGVFPAGAQGLCDDLAAAVSAKLASAGQVRTRAYELPYVRGAGHVAEKTLNVGLSPASVVCRELAMTLSFYSSQNVKRKRGRLYIPMQWLGSTSIGVRPTGAQMTAVLGWRTMFENLGGTNVDWIVWSTIDQVKRSVSNVWVDDEWDVVRSRGLKSSTRQLATTSEGGFTLLALQPQPTDTSGMDTSGGGGAHSAGEPAGDLAA